MSTIFDLSDKQQINKSIIAAKNALNKDELIVFPTDTVYGVAANAFSENGIQKLLLTKNRGSNFPPPVLISSKEMVYVFAENINKESQVLMEKFWPGALTLIFESNPNLECGLGKNIETIALRIPNNKYNLELLTLCGPLAVSSANCHGKKPAHTYEEAYRQLGNKISVYIKHRIIEKEKLSSTIVDTTKTPMHILREGLISFEQLQGVCPDITI